MQSRIVGGTGVSVSDLALGSTRLGASDNSDDDGPVSVCGPAD
jgi:aryl-alcohol dehydrogenase-like predicted oxidoreductase